MEGLKTEAFNSFRTSVQFLTRHKATTYKTESKGNLEEWLARRRYPYQTNTTLTTDKHPCLGRNSKPQSNQTSDRRSRT